MGASQPFDHIMLSVHAGTNRKLKRLTPTERWCFATGVLALAGLAEPRGALLITEGVPVTAEDCAEQAGVPAAAAQSCLEKLRELGTIVPSEDGTHEVVRDWDEHQPAPRRRYASDSPEATRDRKRRSRAGHEQVTTRDEAGHDGEGKRSEGEGTPPTPPTGGAPFPGPPPEGKRQREHAAWEHSVAVYAREHFPDLPQAEQYVGAALGRNGARNHAELLQNRHLASALRRQAEAEREAVIA